MLASGFSKICLFHDNVTLFLFEESAQEVGEEGSCLTICHYSRAIQSGFFFN
jgi:hypothetical protein